jgi:hypothetical protein
VLFTQIHAFDIDLAMLAVLKILILYCIWGLMTNYATVCQHLTAPIMDHKNDLLPHLLL